MAGKFVGKVRYLLNETRYSVVLGIKICGMVDFLTVVNTILVANSNRNEVIREKLFLGHFFTFPHCSDAETKSYIIKFRLV